jgi:8-oxo-dGTP diphosphatase
MIPLLIDVGCAIIRRHDKILISQRKLDDHLGGYWEFPGGKRECDESLEQCLVREIEEELGITIVPFRLLQVVKHAYPERILALHFYLCDWKSGEPEKKEVHDFRWVLPEALKEFNFPPADDGIIAELIRDKALHFRSFTA